MTSLPTTAHCDGAIFQAEFHFWGLQHLTSVAYYPEDNGLYGHTIGTLKQYLKRLADGDLKRWSEYMGLVVRAY